MVGADLKFHHKNNCAASQGLPAGAEQLSPCRRVTEFSVRSKQPLQILFLAYSSLDNQHFDLNMFHFTLK